MNIFSGCTVEVYKVYKVYKVRLFQSFQPLFFLFTIFKPLHTSLTAQTFISTQPVGKTISLITSSVTSVAMPDDFLYHDIQMIKLFFASLIIFIKLFFNSSFEITNTCTKSA